jgi:DNA ligase-1
MASILSELFLRCNSEDIASLVYFCQGKIGPKYQGKEINIGLSTLISVISRYLGHTESTISENFKKLGDLGLVIDTLKSKKTQQTLFSKKQSFREIYSTFERMTLIDGKGAIDTKIKLFESILYNSDLRSAKYIVRFPISLRLGFSDATLIDALSLFLKEEEQKEARSLLLEKYNLISDLGLLAHKFKEKGLSSIKNLSVELFIPVKPALCERCKSLVDIYDRLGKENSFLVDYKIDGFRMQVHKSKEKVKIFSRNEEDMTSMFPDIVSNALSIPHDFIIDSEAIAFDSKNNKYYAFQITMQRKRKYDILEKSKELPLHLKVFDIIYFKKETVLFKPFSERRKLIEENFNYPPVVTPTKCITTDNLGDLENFFNESINNGFEGIIAKDLHSGYSAGSRGFNWIKFKKSYNGSMDTIDAVVLGAFYGQGKRTITGIGALLVGIYDNATNKYYTLAKLGSGLKDEVLKELSETLKNLTIVEKPSDLVTNTEPDFYVIPKIIVEINFDDITISSVHTTPLLNSNETLALRFPRFVKYRVDKQEKETTSLEEMSRFYNLQKSV